MKKIVLLYVAVAFGLIQANAIAIKSPHRSRQNVAQPLGDTSAFWITESSGFTETARGIQQIVAPNGSSAWASAYDGTGGGANVQDYTRTTNSGTTWTHGIVDSNFLTLNWSCLTAIDGDTAWSAFYNGAKGSGGYVYKTEDGQHWTAQSVFSASSFADVIYFWNANTGVAFGDPLGGYYEIYTTSDGGTTWTRVAKDSIPAPTSGEAGLTASFTARDNVLWCGTSSGRVYRSEDYGHHWTVSAITPAAGQYVVHMTFLNEATGYVETQVPVSGGAITWYQTTDSGTTWLPLIPTTGTMFTDDMVYVPGTANTLVSTGANSKLAIGSSYSLDGGISWTLIDTAVQYTTVEFYNESTGYAGGFNTDSVSDGIFKFAGNFINTGVPIIGTHAFNLHVYPNPVNDNLYVSFDANNFNAINLRIYDLLGRTVFGTTYHDKTQLWLRSINLNNLSNGIYTLEVNNNGNKEVQKIVVQH